MLRDSLRRHINGIGDATSLLEAGKGIVAIGKELGLGRPSFIEDFGGGPKSKLYRELLGEGSEWLLPSCSDLAFSAEKSCPVFRACRVSFEPFVWQMANILQADESHDSSRRSFFRIASKHGITGGVTVPVHMPKSRLGAVGWFAQSPDVNLDRILACSSHELRLAGHLFMGHVFRQRPEPWSRPYDTPLTERELECLTWVALGKTDSEIGELIGRAPSTARFHVESAIEKLGVNNRARAAAVACQIGLINALA
ncbi:MAG: hypothetical protein GC189_05670 [Alphaproteobacteria bacterium]|nr:hypothetical protein [Alphaproteobacteria bacterium]